MKDQEFIVQRIRSQYTEQEHTELNTLKALYAKVNRPANVFSYTYGSIGAIVMGAGMSLVMTELGSAFGSLAMIFGIIVGLIGLAMVAAAHPIFNWVLKMEREKIASEILKLTDELL